MTAPAHLTRAAKAAASAFLEVDVALEVLSHGQSLALRVDADRGRFLLRVHSPRCPPPRPEFFAPQALESECLWLQALSEQTTIGVQRPVPAPSGGFVELVETDSSPEPIPCTLLHWIEGEHVEGRRTDDQARLLGSLLAELRAHATAWQPPASFSRPIHDRESWRSALERFEHLIAAGVATAQDRDLLARAIDRADEELTPLMADPDRVGLVHADLHGGNYLFRDGVPYPIDFGLCGFGPWLWDVAECLAHVGPQLRRQIVDSYARTWSLEEADIARLEGYFLASLVEVLGNNSPDPGEHGFLSKAVPAWAPHFRRYVEGAPFLFEL